jgi:hypothetical protein
MFEKFVQLIIFTIVRVLAFTYKFEFYNKENFLIAKDKSEHGNYLLGF